MITCILRSYVRRTLDTVHCNWYAISMSKHPELPEGLQKELRETADAIVRDGHGLLAADESIGSMEKRFLKIGQLMISRFIHKTLYALTILETSILIGLGGGPN